MAPPIILSEKEIHERLKDLPDWLYKDGKIISEIKFSSFPEAIKFINKLAPIFEKIQHHADMHIFYDKIIFELQTFDVGGKVTDKDFTVAEKISKMAESYCDRDVK